MTLTAEQLASRLLHSIRIGEWPPGTPLPSIRALAAAHRVGRNIAENALRELRESGAITARPGAGHIVADDNTPHAVRVDSRHRISLGAAAGPPGTRYRAEFHANGTVTLTRLPPT